MEGMAHQYCLRWNNFQNNIASALGSLKAEEDLVDVTLSCGGRIVKAHKVVLSACSPYFREVFKENPCQHPVVILKDVSYEDILSLLSFMYVGEVYITKEQIQTFLQTAELLQIRGLAGVTNLAKEQQVEAAPPSKTHVPPPLSTLYPKHGLHVGGSSSDSGAQLKHALISKRSRTSTSTSATGTPKTPSGTPSGTPSTAPSPPPSPPLGRSSAPSSPQPLAPKRRKAVPRRVSTSSSGSGLPGEQGSGSTSGCPPDDGDSVDQLVVNVAVKQEVEDVELKDDVDDGEDVGDPDNEQDGDSRGDERPYYLDSDQDGEAGTSSSLLARSLAGASPRGIEGAVLLSAGSLGATNNQTMGADLTVDLDRDGMYSSWAAAGSAATLAFAGPLYDEPHAAEVPYLGGHLPGRRQPGERSPVGGPGGGHEPRPPGTHYQTSSAASNWGCMQPRSCPMCHRTFSNKFNLKQHIENVHSPGKPIPCQICNRFFKNKWYLRKHCVTTHNAPLRRIKTPWGKIMYVSDNPYDGGTNVRPKMESSQQSTSDSVS